ncbi:unnamed protein product [Leptosia nina]|uniref:Tyrosine specific protein phosphatases domain-containing protein n=1 Tax=Leptosia nina TaxID=320188 RepID=A0AAV1K0V3_9NEOP
MAPSIPDRWIPYKAFGKVIEGTRIICFKVPLRHIVQVNNPAIKHIWDIDTLLKKFPKLKAVVDLTNTSRYYDPKELKSAGVLHKKILLPGRIIPPERKVMEFMNTVDELLENDDGSLIGVHCTHGLNRTGYMVCRYLRDRLLVPPTVAIERFEKARGYKIERENYIADILGKKPPPPDIGVSTTINPIDTDDCQDNEAATETKRVSEDDEWTLRRKRKYLDLDRNTYEKRGKAAPNSPTTSYGYNNRKDQDQEPQSGPYSGYNKRKVNSQRDFIYKSPLIQEEEEVEGHTMRQVVDQSNRTLYIALFLTVG